MALTLVLLVGAGLLGRSFVRLLAVDPGYRTERAVVLDLSLPYPESAADKGRLVAFYDELLGRLRALPGVADVGAVNAFPLVGGNAGDGTFVILSRPDEPLTMETFERLMKDPSRTGEAEFRVASDGYFRAMGIPIKAGRPLTDADLANTPAVAVVSETLARTFWPNESAVGKFIDYEWDHMEHVQIVGIAGDVHHEGVDKEPLMEIYRPLPQFVYNTLTLVVRTTGDPAQLARPFREAVQNIDRDQPVGKLETMEALVSESLGASRLSTMLFGLFGIIGLVLASVGIYGVISYGVIQRTREFGVRMALGARPNDVRTMVVREGMVLTAIGIAVGLIGAFVLTRLMRTLLFDVTPSDPVTFVGIALVLGTVAILASYLPARRATRVDPLVALRDV
jgi:predicted permease